MQFSQLLLLYWTSSPVDLASRSPYYNSCLGLHVQILHTDGDGHRVLVFKTHACGVSLRVCMCVGAPVHVRIQRCVCAQVCVRVCVLVSAHICWLCVPRWCACVHACGPCVRACARVHLCICVCIAVVHVHGRACVCVGPCVRACARVHLCACACRLICAVMSNALAHLSSAELS
jgi:hypothetical protein